METPEEAPERKPGEPVTITLKEPIDMGSRKITELVLRFNARAMRDVTIMLAPDGSRVIRPYDLARAAVRMAGEADPVFEKLGGLDFMACAEAAGLFLS